MIALVVVTVLVTLTSNGNEEKFERNMGVPATGWPPMSLTGWGKRIESFDRTNYNAQPRCYLVSLPGSHGQLGRTVPVQRPPTTRARDGLVRPLARADSSSLNGDPGTGDLRVQSGTPVRGS